MSDTPRTDAVMHDKLRDGNDLPNLARQLERENLQLVSESCNRMYDLSKENRELKRELAEAKAENARLRRIEELARGTVEAGAVEEIHLGLLRDALNK